MSDSAARICAEGEGRSVPVLCVLCGLPGAGKTTLVHRMKDAVQASDSRLSYVGFDDIEMMLAPGEKDGQLRGVWSVEAWKESRRRAFEEAEKHLDDSSGGAAEGAGLPQLPKQHYVILDDNMYYRSMRREAYKLAARRGAGFALVYVHVPLDTALQRNAGREPKQRVAEDIIGRMHGRLEPPDADKAHWEATHVVIHDAKDGPSLERIFQLLEHASKSPAVIQSLDEEVAEAGRAAARLITRSSIVHRIDIFLRKVINGAMKAPKQPGCPLPSPGDLARMLNEARQSELEKLRITEGHGHMTESYYDEVKTTASLGFIETVTSAIDPSPGKCAVRQLLQGVLLVVNVNQGSTY